MLPKRRTWILTFDGGQAAKAGTDQYADAFRVLLGNLEA
jgi:hypothetical protein